MDIPHLVVLGVAQDGGHPQIGCWRACCQPAWDDPSLGHTPACLALVDPTGQRRWLLDATPSIAPQLASLGPPAEGRPALDGIVVTHAHLGHVHGLLHLGREALAAEAMPVYALKRLRAMLTEHLPWSLLASHGHMEVRSLEDGADLGPFRVTAQRVPHRGEASETAALRIDGPSSSALYLPDIDRWHGWSTAVEDLVRSVDIAYLDGTFYDDGEIGWRDPSTVPHPRVKDTMSLLAGLPEAERRKVHFIHLNHTNPLLDPDSDASKEVVRRGFRVAREGQKHEL